MAAGAAWSAQLRGTGQVAVAFFGDGATNIGAFHEALNLAAVWKLPVLFVCENNLYMEYTPIVCRHRSAQPGSRPGRRLRPAGRDHRRQRRDRGPGSDRQSPCDRARAGEGPTCIEALTYRHYGHSRTDPGKYRPAEEVERWLQRDPLIVARERLDGLGVDAADVDAIDAPSGRGDRRRPFEEAKDAPYPDPATALTDVWADGGAAWRTLITYREAVAEGIAREMRRDSRVVCLGEDIGAADGVFKTTAGPVRGVRAGAGVGHADLRAGDRRGGAWAPR